MAVDFIHDVFVSTCVVFVHVGVSRLLVASRGLGTPFALTALQTGVPMCASVSFGYVQFTGLCRLADAGYAFLKIVARSVFRIIDIGSSRFLDVSQY